MADVAPPLSRLRAADAPRAAYVLGRAFALLVALTTALIVLGALVRAHGAGLACPDWPLCFGTLVPRMNLEVAFEWTHRLVAGSMSLGFVALAAATARDAALRARVGLLLAVGCGLLALQILLGALTVWHLLARWTVTSHLVVGNSFNACLLLVALRLRETAAGPRPARAGRAREDAERARRARTAIAAAAGLLALQIVLGGLVSSGGAGMACPEWPRCNGGFWAPSLRGNVGLHLAHRWNAMLVVAALAGAVLAARGVPRVGRLAALALGLALVQACLGIANVLLAIPVEVTALHSLGSALLVLTLTAALYRGAGAAA